MYEEDDELGYLGCPECGEAGELVSVWKCVNCGIHVCDACCAPSYLCLDCEDETSGWPLEGLDEVENER